MIKELIDESLRLDNDDGSYQHATYSQPNYRDLSSACKDLDKAIANFFNACVEKCDGE